LFFPMGKDEEKSIYDKILSKSFKDDGLKQVEGKRTKMLR